eukprot:3659815-Rhodomonas_salina.3
MNIRSELSIERELFIASADLLATTSLSRFPNSTVTEGVVPEENSSRPRPPSLSSLPPALAREVIPRMHLP